MKLLSCHIENYGKISQADFDFQDGITSFCQENGYGKSTLASFLKAMFYGLESDGANKNFNERRHFVPFAGGNFGGFVRFSYRGETYKIERFFDAKSETKDVCNLYRGAVKVNSGTGNLGERIFGIDRQSFERTIFISASEIEIASTGSINSKLFGVMQKSEEERNLDDALAVLEAKSKEYKKSRQGKGDLISNEKSRIYTLSAQIDNLEKIANGLPEKYARLQLYNEKIGDLQKKISASQSVNLLLKDWETHDSLANEGQECERKLNALASVYPFGLPSQEEWNEASKCHTTLQSLSAQNSGELSSEEETAFSSLWRRFPNGVPSAESIKAQENELIALTQIESELSALQQSKPLIDERLHQKFRLLRSEDEVRALQEKANSYQKAENAWKDGLSEKTKKVNKPSLLLLCLSLLLIAVGILCLSMSPVIGLVFLGVGGCLLITGWAFARSNGAKNGGVNSTGRRELDRLENEIAAFLVPFGYSLSNGVPYAVASFVGDRQTYLRQMEEAENWKKAYEVKHSEKVAREEKAKAFYERFSFTGGDLWEKHSLLRDAIAKYSALLERKQSAEKRNATLEQDLAKNKAELLAFCQKYHLPTASIGELLTTLLRDIQLFQALTTAKEQAQSKAEKLKKEKSLTERPNLAFINVEELNERVTELISERSSLSRQIADDERDAETLESCIVEREKAQNRLQDYERKYDLLVKTMDCLKEADAKLKDKYIRPIKEQFFYYADLLEKALGRKFIMSPNFEIRYEQNGKERSEKHLSDGQKSICAFCFRLALIDNMYNEEKPFLILDDPFVQLDHAHLEKVKFLLKELSKKLQIVYFCCHESRDME